MWGPGIGWRSAWHWFRCAQDESISTVGVLGLISPVQNLVFSVVFLLKAGHLVGTR